MNNVMRDEFELAWQVKGMDDEGNLGNKPTRSKTDDDKYAGEAAQFAWMWWKRSRDSLVIELPEPVIKGMACVYYNHDIENALENAGVNYK